MFWHEFGVNPQDACGAGSDAEAYASGFTGLHGDFNGVLDLARQACAHRPEVTGWDAYGEEQASTIAKVEEHGISLAGNIQGAASEAAVTDQQISEAFESVDVPLSRREFIGTYTTGPQEQYGELVENHRARTAREIADMIGR